MTGEILRCLVHATAAGLAAALILAVDPGPAFTNDPSIPSEEQKQTDQDRCKSPENINASILSLTPLAWRKTLVVLLEGLGGRPTSPGIVSLQNDFNGAWTSSRTYNRQGFDPHRPLQLARTPFWVCQNEADRIADLALCADAVLLLQFPAIFGDPYLVVFLPWLSSSALFA